MVVVVVVLVVVLVVVVVVVVLVVVCTKSLAGTFRIRPRPATLRCLQQARSLHVAPHRCVAHSTIAPPPQDGIK